MTTIQTTYEDLNAFNSNYHLMQYGNSAIFDRIAHLAEHGIDSRTLATLLYVVSDCDRETGIADMENKINVWFDIENPAAVSRRNNPRLVAEIVRVSKDFPEVFQTKVTANNIVLLESAERDGVVTSVGFSVDGKGYAISFEPGNDFACHADVFDDVY